MEINNFVQGINIVGFGSLIKRVTLDSNHHGLITPYWVSWSVIENSLITNSIDNAIEKVSAGYSFSYTFRNVTVLNTNVSKYDLFIHNNSYSNLKFEDSYFENYYQATVNFYEALKNVINHLSKKRFLIF